ncbi:putative phage abortive infection protein [Tardiphaga sp. 172_B4_N1_3]|uniref:putative phage abortive infection protein n=1 Tax=Tardiphaga sp. 172_B4_N1_3 TaxID=3240787 RepID=UPI003F8AAD29
MTRTISQAKPGLGRPFAFALLALFILATAIIGTAIYVGYHNVDWYKDLGTWGDFFGGTLNPILTFLTFIGVLLTIALQKIEMNLTREELGRSADALENQIQTTRKQIFESTFFQMLSLHNNIVNSIDLFNSETGVTTQGRDCFRAFYTRLTKIYRDNQKKAQKNHSDEKILELSYKLYWKEVQLDLGHYYRYLFNMIRFVKKNSPDDDFYIKLIRSQLSDQELLLLFYNCLSEQGQNFRLYAEEFALFDNMPRRLLEQEHRARFSPAAYGEQ